MRSRSSSRKTQICTKESCYEYDYVHQLDEYRGFELSSLSYTLRASLY